MKHEGVTYNKIFSFVPKISEKIDFSIREGFVVISRRNNGYINFIFQKIFHKPRFSYLYLDEIGSFVFLQIDGKKNIQTLCELVKARFKFCDISSFCKYMLILVRCGIIKLEENIK